MRAVFIAFFFSLLCGRAGAHFTESRLRGEDARSFTQASKRDDARGFKDQRLGRMEERTRTVSGITGVTTRRWFQWGADLSGTLDGAGGIGGLVGIIEEDGAGLVTRTLLPVQDGLGNITAVIDQATGRTVARYDYGPFGEALSESGEVDACPFRWQTKWYDAESQHYYFGYRHYDPRFGRWLSRDPMGEAGGFNLYAYCGNDPVNRHDPLGLAAIADDPVNPFGDSLESYRKQIFGMRKDRKDREKWEGTLFSAGLGDGFKNIPPGLSLTIKQSLALSLVPAAVILAPMVAATAGEATLAAYVRVGIWAAGEGAVAVQTATVVGGGLLAFQCQDPATRENLVDGFVAGGPGGVISVEGQLAAREIQAGMLLFRNESKALQAEIKTLVGVYAEFVAANATVRGETFFIENGVRRSLVSQNAGLSEIPATIFRPGSAPTTTTLRLDQLMSPKTTVPLDSRYLNIQPPIHSPIQVQPFGLPNQPPSIPLRNVILE